MAATAKSNFQSVATWTGAGETLADARTQATTLTEYGYDSLGRLTSTTAVRRFGANVDVDPVAAGIQPEKTQTVYGVDGQINYELIAAKGGDLTKDYVYDSQGRTQKIDYFADANGNHVLDTGENNSNGTWFKDPGTLTRRNAKQDGERFASLGRYPRSSASFPAPGYPAGRF